MKRYLLYLLTLAVLAISCQKEIPVTGITLLPEYLELMEGETSNVWASLIPEDATDRTVIWTSTDETVVTVNKGIVYAGEAGLAQITVSTVDGLYSASCLVRVLETHEAVDMGLSVKWVSVNIYAESPEDCGDYFSWGEISPKPSHKWENYQWGIKDETAGPLFGMTRYTGSVEGGDNLSVLLPEDDAASKIWGGIWRTPTIEEYKELHDEKNSIVHWDSSTASGVGSDCNYWSASLNTNDPTLAKYIYVYNGTPFWDKTSRHIGLPVRAVTDK